MNKYNNFLLVITCTKNNDNIVKSVFDGRDVLFCKLNYIPPCDELTLIKKIQLCSKERNLFSMDKPVISLDISEWIGHENEEYLHIILKYLHDKSSKWDYAFTVSDYEEKEAWEIYLILRQYMIGNIYETKVFTELQAMQKYIVQEFAFKPDAAYLLAKVLLATEFKEQRGQAFLRQSVEELTQHSKSKQISLPELERILTEENTILSLIGKSKVYEIVTNERELSNEL